LNHGPTEPEHDRLENAVPDGRRVPRLQLVAWRDALSLASTIQGVVDVVQRIAYALRARSPSLPSRWQPRHIHSREDIEHWARRLRSRPPARPGGDSLVPLAGLMRFAVERMNELGPRRAEESVRR
jgi:hypothetical protein